MPVELVSTESVDTRFIYCRHARAVLVLTHREREGGGGGDESVVLARGHSNAYKPVPPFSLFLNRALALRIAWIFSLLLGL